MMHRIISFAALGMFFWSCLSAQTPVNYPEDSDFIDANAISVSLNSGGDLSWDLVGDPRFEAPKGSENHTIFAANLWIGGLDESGGLRMGAHTYRQSGIDFWPGPKADIYDSAYYEKYGHVWKVSAEDITSHKQLWQDPSYLAPADIITWPGNGDTTKGEPWLIAPFVDINSNSVYEPEQGEYPAIPGDEAMFIIYSDAHYPNSETGGASLGVDVHTMVFQFGDSSQKALNQTVFVSHQVINRSTHHYQDLYLGQWVDFDIGSFSDDYVGCDSSRHAFFGYNSDDFDGGPPQAYGYGNHPPAQAVLFLNQPMTTFTAYKSDFSTTGSPAMATDFYGYLQGSWKDGSSFTEGGNGFGGTSPIRFLYPGDPRDSSQWSMMTAAPGVSDWKTMGSTGPFSLLKGESVCLDLALVFARSDTGNHLDAITEMYHHLDDIRLFADTTTAILSCSFMNAQALTSIEEGGLSEIEVFPNPATEKLTIRGLPANTELRVMNLLGEVLFYHSAPPETIQLNVSDWASGLYVVDILGTSTHAVHKVLVR